jgi:uncharacterized membrane protein
MNNLKSFKALQNSKTRVKRKSKIKLLSVFNLLSLITCILVSYCIVSYTDSKQAYNQTQNSEIRELKLSALRLASSFEEYNIKRFPQ